MIVVRCPLPRVSSSRQIFPALRSHWLPSLARTVACPAIRNIHCLYGVQCQPPTQSAANLRRFHPEARLVAETSSGGAGGANRSDWNVMVAVSMCDSPASSENTRMYSKVRRISTLPVVCDSQIFLDGTGSVSLCFALPGQEGLECDRLQAPGLRVSGREGGP